MNSGLQTELKQGKPFATLEQEVALNIMRTAAYLRQTTASVLKPHDVSLPQYNVLRILRGATDEGLPCSEVGNRLVARDPDVTRLLDGLEKRGLVVRGRSSTDRRVVNARITDKGSALTNQLDEPMTGIHDRQLGHMKKKHLKNLIELLERVRGNESSDEEDE